MSGQLSSIWLGVDNDKNVTRKFNKKNLHGFFLVGNKVHIKNLPFFRDLFEL